MGFFDKIKSITNAVTGGAAKVTVEVKEAKLNAPFEVLIRAQSQGSEVKYNRVYLKVESIENVQVPDTEVHYVDQNASNRKSETVSANATLTSLELKAAESGMIGANETAEWKVMVELPKNSPPEYKGKYTEHYFRILAGLDTVGNDPDSGWIKLNVR